MNALVVLTAIAIAVGVVGTVLPIVPGLWLIWAASLVFAVIDGFGAAAWAGMILITVLALGGTVAGIFLPQRSASGVGISRLGQLLALALGVVGFFVIPIIGAAIGFIVGILAAAILHTRDVRRAWEATVAVLKGIALASGAQFGTGLLMAAVWVSWVVAS